MIVAPPIVGDPGFQMSPVGTGTSAYAYDPTGTPWSYSGSSGLAGNGSGFTGGNPDSPSGSQVAFLQGTGSISQSVDLAAGTYAVSFQAAQRGKVNHGGQIIRVIVNNMPVGTVIAPASSSYATYTTSATFPASAGIHTIELEGTDAPGGDNTAFVTNVMIVAPPIVGDPGFQMSPVGTGTSAYAYDPTGTPWSYSGSSGLAGNGSGFTGGNPDSPSGSQVAFLQGTGSTSQTVTLTAGTYVVGFDAAQRGNLDQRGQQIQVNVNGSPVSTITPADASYASYSSASFAVTDGSHTIALAGLDLNTGDNTAFVANVMILAPPSESDPGFTMSSVGSGPSAYQYDPADSPWTFTGDAGVAGNGSGFTGGNPDSPSGGQVAFLQGTGSISQSVNLAAGSYVVSFQAAQRGKVNHGGQTIRVIVNNMPVGTAIAPASSTYASYTTSAALTFATDGMHTIELEGTNAPGGDNTAFISNVMIVAPPVVADAGFQMSPVGTGTSAYQYTPTGTPWTYSASAGVAGNNSDFTRGNPDSPSGSQVAFLQGTGSISQSVDLAAGTYVVSFQAAQRGNVNHGGQTIRVIVDNMPVGTAIAPASSTYASYTTSAALTFATDGMHTIELEGTDAPGGDNTAFVTNVMIVAPPIVGDPGFQMSPVGTGTSAYAYDPTGTPWSYSGSSGLAGNGSGFTGGNPDSPSGGQVAFLQGTGSISQTVSVNAGTYSVNLEAAQRANDNNGGQEFEILVDNVVVATIAPVSGSYALYSTGDFTLAAGSHSIALVGLNPFGGDNTALIDQVNIQQD